MFKKSLATALLVAAVPAVASASWFLSTQAMNQGGTVTTRNGAQTVLDGAVFKSYTTQAGIPVTVTAATGFTIKSVTVNGVTSSNLGTLFSTTLSGSGTADKSVSAVFAAGTQSVTATNDFGTVTPASVGNIYYGYELKDKLVFSFAPKFGYKIDSISNVPGASPAGKTPVVSTTGVVNQRVTVTFPAGFVVNAPINLVAVASNTVADLNPVLPQTIVVGKKATLTATPNDQLTGATYEWKYVSGPANTKVGQGGTQGTVNGDAGLTSTTDVVAGPLLSITTPNAASTGEISGFTTPGQYKFVVTATANGVKYTKMAVINVAANAFAGSYNTCQFCHTANKIGATATQTSKAYIYDNWSTSAHAHFACYQCHQNANVGGHPGTLTCTGCHHGTDYAAVPYPQGRPIPVAGQEASCAHCHAADGKNLHAVTKAAIEAKTSCIGCHDVAAPQHKLADGTDGVNDNNGVRAITGEFQKWSHHVTGVTLNDAHCAACHLEGTVSNGAIVPSALHMADAKTHLRDTTAGTDADFAWDPNAPSHSGMDTFCLSCHDNDGAVSTESSAIRALINTAGGAYNTGIAASATNPFGDTISNRYDKMRRPAVVDAKGQFAVTNPSHHAVLGQKYLKRTRVVNAGDPRAMTAAQVLAFTNNSGAVADGKTTGARSTIFDSRVKRSTNLDGYGAYNVSKFVSTYETLTGPPTAPADKTLGDDSVLHCGDCHTVGQFRAADVQTDLTDPNNLKKNRAVIGAHGSNNEYMLRNFAGTDERHVGQKYSAGPDKVAYFVGTNPAAPNYNAPLSAAQLNSQPWLVCFNCHSYQNYGSIGSATGATGVNHAGEYANGNRCNGPINTISFGGYTTGAETDADPYVGRLGEGHLDNEGQIGANGDTDFSNTFGMQCANCHNAGPKNAFGGIHGAKFGNYTDANGAGQKAYRFLPGLGNTMFVPGSAAGVGSVSDLNWEVKSIGTVNTSGTITDNGGCYTLVPEGTDGTNADFSVSPTYQQKDYTGQTNLFGTWGGCDDHRGNAHGKAGADATYPFAGGTVPTGGAGVVRKVLRPVTY